MNEFSLIANLVDTYTEAFRGEWNCACQL